MYANNRTILQIISLIKQFGIRKVVVSPGCRHIPLVYSLEQDSDFRLYTVVDERSAAFFALGLIQQSGEPVAVTCTSGTACQNYGSALVEAFYQKRPLLVLSGDRHEAFLGQNEDQMYDQSNSFQHCTKYQVKLPYIQSEIDDWYTNRLINEALIELTTHGRGPVHINFPILDCRTCPMDVSLLPIERKINWHSHTLRDSEWTAMANILKGKKVAVLMAQGVELTDELSETLDLFCDTFDAPILTDKLSNYHNRHAILNTWVLLSYMNSEDRKLLAPDVIITLGGQYFFINSMREWMLSTKSIHWQVGNDTKPCDQFHNLRDVFEMNETDFFRNMTECSVFENKGNYVKVWKDLSTRPKSPSDVYGEMYAIGRLMQHLPFEADLQLANSLTIRFSNFFELHPNIKVNCNRALSGIDGSLSTAIGYAAASNKRMFYITGDLSFFYDMNALSIKHLPKDFSIMMINNNGGGCLFNGDNTIKDGILPINCASHHLVEAKRWVESCGFKYIAAHTSKDVDKAVGYMVSSNERVFIEVFTDMVEDFKSMNTYIWDEVASERRIIYHPSFKQRAIRKTKKIANKVLTKEKINAIKILLQ